jgi:hypothetical protein
MSDALLVARDFGFANQTCDPYFNGDCEDMKKHHNQCDASSERSGLIPTAKCDSRCEDGSVKSRRKLVKDIYWLNAGYGGRTSPYATSIIMQEYIMKTGPLIAGIAIYPDFENDNWSREGRVYVHKHDPSQRLMGGHAIVIVGWGVDKRENGKHIPYWIAKNSWSSSWGDQGYFKLIRGQGGGESSFVSHRYRTS